MTDTDTGTDTALATTAPEVEFLLSGDEVAEAFIGLVAKTDPELLRSVFSNTTLLFLSNARGDADEIGDDELREVLIGAAEQAFELIVAELESIRDAKVAFASGSLGFVS